MGKKFLVMLLMSALCMSTSIFSFADNLENQDIIMKSTIIENKAIRSSEITKNDDSGMVIIYGTDPGYGSVKIDDVLTSTSGWTDVANVNYITYEISKLALVKIIKGVPVIGDIYSRGEDIYDDLKSIHSIMAYIDSEGETQYVTKYSYRNFYHKLYVWNYNNSWYDAGYSLNRYFYKSEAMYYIDTYGEAQTKSYDFTYTNGYSPKVVAEAPHYMDLSYLSSQAIYSWSHNIRYVETY